MDGWYSHYLLCFLMNKLKTYSAGVLHHGVSETAVSLCFKLQVIGALQDYSFLQVAGPFVHIAHRVLAVVGDGLGRLFGQQADKRHLDCNGVCRLIFVAIRELETQARQSWCQGQCDFLKDQSRPSQYDNRIKLKG